MSKGELDRPDELRAACVRLGRLRGRDYWRSLEELSGDAGFREMLEREFPARAAELDATTDRRSFLQLMGATLALAGITGCTRQPEEPIAPFVRQPEGLVPGRPLYYATAMTLGGAASGLLVTSREGRPTKVEGNPDHPSSLGATDRFSQAAVLDLYDPDRSQATSYLGTIQPHAAFLAALEAAIEVERPRGGAGLRVLTEAVVSPTLGAQLAELRSRLPAARWHQWEPAARDTALRGALAAWGRVVHTLPRLEHAEVIFSIDADFLGAGPGHLRAVREFTEGRRLGAGRDAMSRLYAVEATPSLTGARADHRLALRPSRIEGLARAVAAAAGVPLARGADAAEHEAWATAVARDLSAHRGSGIVLAGDEQPASVHALAHAMNLALGNVGSTLSLIEPIEVEPVDHAASLSELVAAMRAGSVDCLLILGGNPVYSAPVDLDFGAALSRVRLAVHLGLHHDETSAACQWHVPEAHFLEAWSDTRGHDGTASIVQPLIAPLYGGRSAHELLSALLDQPVRDGHAIVRDHWRSRLPGEFEASWRGVLHDGLVPGTAARELSVELRAGWDDGPPPPASREGLEVVFRTDPTVHDGRFANNGWLQELPKPLTRLTWDNAVLIAPATARRLGLAVTFDSRGGEHGLAWADEVEIEHGGRRLRGPVWILPGQPEETLTLCLGYGRTRAGRLGSGTGFDAYRLRTSAAPWSLDGVQLSATGERRALANTQGHWSMEGRDLIRSGTLDEYRHHPSLAPHGSHAAEPALSMYPPFKYEGHAWGMAIDLSACTGCNACVVACQAENNIPVVGKDQVAAGREMHWLRVDRYYSGDPDDSDSLGTHFQPVPCQHCENAPCEVVCPVAATVHSAEGLNDMVYNRCVGTRYCSNNCPYKVRRFNFFLYQDWNTPSLKLLRNPEVTVRSRGVMEKCTYCVQRIQRGKIDAELAGRSVRDGEIRTACEQACPAQAIVFGDINDAESRVARLKADPRNYSLLADLNTRPRTTYLGAVRNPNPALDENG